MKRSTTITLIVIAAVLVAGGILLATRKPAPDATPTPSPSPAQTSSPAASAPSAAHPSAESATVTYTDSGFSPSTVTVKAGGTFTVKNNSASTIQVDSNPHPQHTDDPQLNIGSLAAGASGTATLSTKGTWHYHNHLDPTMTGTVVVE